MEAVGYFPSKCSYGVLGIKISKCPYRDSKLPYYIYGKKKSNCFCGAIIILLIFNLLLYWTSFSVQSSNSFSRAGNTALNTAGEEIMNYTDRKPLKGCIKCGTDYRYDNSFWRQYILAVDPTWGTFKVRRSTDFLGQISMETESQRAVCGAVLGGGLL